MAVGGPGTARGAPWTLAADEEDDLREFLRALGDTPAGGPVGWALGRFEMGCERAHDAEALSDYLLGLRALLDATNDAGEASVALRVSALCAEEGQRRAVQRRIEAALSLERFLMGGRGSLQERIGSESPRDLVHEMESHLRALLRDVLCGYLEPNLKSVADDILLETAPEPFALEDERGSDLRVEARDLRLPVEPESEPAPSDRETTEFEAVADTVTASAEARAARPAAARRRDRVRRLGLGRPRGLLGARVAVGLGAGAEIERHQHVVHVAPLEPELLTEHALDPEAARFIEPACGRVRRQHPKRETPRAPRPGLADGGSHQPAPEALAPSRRIDRQALDPQDVGVCRQGRDRPELDVPGHLVVDARPAARPPDDRPERRSACRAPGTEPG